MAEAITQQDIKVHAKALEIKTKAKALGIGVLQMNTVGVLQLLNFRRNIFV